MALNSSGVISIGGSTTGQSINLEFNRAATATTSMSELYRGGSVVPEATANAAIPTSGAISLGQFYGAVRRISVAITVTSQNNYVANTAKVTGYIAGVTDAHFTVTGTVGSTTTGAAFTVDGSWTAGDTVTITINSGVYITGLGGPGGNANSTAGGNGGLALSVARATTIYNNGTIQGGGGGGGAGRGGYTYVFYGYGATKGYAGIPSYYNQYAGGGGGGGGTGTAVGTAGGAGYNTVGYTYIAIWPFDYSAAPGAGGTGSLTAGASGGGGGQCGYLGSGWYTWGAPGGAGGAAAVNGSAGSTTINSNCGPLAEWYAATAGGPAGNCTSGNANITWGTIGTRIGTLG